jgi:hypothetical protein
MMSVPPGRRNLFASRLTLLWRIMWLRALFFGALFFSLFLVWLIVAPIPGSRPVTDIGGLVLLAALSIFWGVFMSWLVGFVARRALQESVNR